MPSAVPPQVSVIDTNAARIANAKKRSLDVAPESPSKVLKVDASSRPSTGHSVDDLAPLKKKFFSASHFAVVGASDVKTKWGYMVMKFLLDQGKDVAPVNNKRDTVLSKKCYKSISDLPDPANTSICLVTRPSDTLAVLEEALKLNVFCLWLQPNTEDQKCIDFIRSSNLQEKCIYFDSIRDNVMLPVLTSEDDDTPPTCFGRSVTDGLPNKAETNPVQKVVNMVSAPCLVAEGHNILTKVGMESEEDRKKQTFLAAKKFAVVGASDTESKWGYKVMRFLINKNKDVVPVNPTRDTIQGRKCLKSLKNLEDPTHTSVSVITRPADTLEILKQAKELGLYSIWLQPLTTDAQCCKYIEESDLQKRCIYTPMDWKASQPSASFAAKIVTPGQVGIATTGPCGFGESVTDA